MPEILARPLFSRMFRLGLWPYPTGALDFIKYPVTLSGRRFVEASGFRPEYGLDEIFSSFRR